MHQITDTSNNDHHDSLSTSFPETTTSTNNASPNNRNWIRHIRSNSSSNNRVDSILDPVMAVAAAEAKTGMGLGMGMGMSLGRFGLGSGSSSGGGIPATAPSMSRTGSKESAAMMVRSGPKETGVKTGNGKERGNEGNGSYTVNGFTVKGFPLDSTTTETGGGGKTAPPSAWNNSPRRPHAASSSSSSSGSIVPGNRTALTRSGRSYSKGNSSNHPHFGIHHQQSSSTSSLASMSSAASSSKVELGLPQPKALGFEPLFAQGREREKEKRSRKERSDKEKGKERERAASDAGLTSHLGVSSNTSPGAQSSPGAGSSSSSPPTPTPVPPTPVAPGWSPQTPYIVTTKMSASPESQESQGNEQNQLGFRDRQGSTGSNSGAAGEDKKIIKWKFTFGGDGKRSPRKSTSKPHSSPPPIVADDGGVLVSATRPPKSKKRKGTRSPSGGSVSASISEPESGNVSSSDEYSADRTGSLDLVEEAVNDEDEMMESLVSSVEGQNLGMREEARGDDFINSNPEEATLMPRSSIVAAALAIENDDGTIGVKRQKMEETESKEGLPTIHSSAGATNSDELKATTPELKVSELDQTDGGEDEHGEQVKQVIKLAKDDNQDSSLGDQRLGIQPQLSVPRSAITPSDTDNREARNRGGGITPEQLAQIAELQQRRTRDAPIIKPPKAKRMTKSSLQAASEDSPRTSPKASRANSFASTSSFASTPGPLSAPVSGGTDPFRSLHRSSTDPPTLTPEALSYYSTSSPATVVGNTAGPSSFSALEITSLPVSAIEPRHADAQAERRRLSRRGRKRTVPPVPLTGSPRSNIEGMRNETSESEGTSASADAGSIADRTSSYSGVSDAVVRSEIQAEMTGQDKTEEKNNDVDGSALAHETLPLGEDSGDNIVEDPLKGAPQSLGGEGTLPVAEEPHSTRECGSAATPTKLPKELSAQIGTSPNKADEDSSPDTATGASTSNRPFTSSPTTTAAVSAVTTGLANAAATPLPLSPAASSPSSSKIPVRTRSKPTAPTITTTRLDSFSSFRDAEPNSFDPHRLGSPPDPMSPMAVLSPGASSERSSGSSRRRRESPHHVQGPRPPSPGLIRSPRSPHPLSQAYDNPFDFERPPSSPFDSDKESSSMSRGKEPRPVSAISTRSPILSGSAEATLGTGSKPNTLSMTLGSPFSTNQISTATSAVTLTRDGSRKRRKIAGDDLMVNSNSDSSGNNSPKAKLDEGGSLNASAQGIPRVSSPQLIDLPPREPLPPSHISVSRDTEQFYIIPTTGFRTPAAVKERIFSRLQIYDEDFTSCRLYRTYIGEQWEDIKGEPLDDEELWELCRKQGENRNQNIMILVKQIKPANSLPTSAVATKPPHTFPPPVPIASAAEDPIISEATPVVHSHANSESTSSLSISSQRESEQQAWERNRSATLQPKPLSPMNEGRARAVSDTGPNGRPLSQEYLVQQSPDLRSSQPRWHRKLPSSGSIIVTAEVAPAPLDVPTSRPIPSSYTDHRGHLSARSPPPETPTSVFATIKGMFSPDGTLSSPFDRSPRSAMTSAPEGTSFQWPPVLHGRRESPNPRAAALHPGHHRVASEEIIDHPRAHRRPQPQPPVPQPPLSPPQYSESPQIGPASGQPHLAPLFGVRGPFTSSSSNSSDPVSLGFATLPPAPQRGLQGAKSHGDLRSTSQMNQPAPPLPSLPSYPNLSPERAPPSFGDGTLTPQSPPAIMSSQIVGDRRRNLPPQPYPMPNASSRLANGERPPRPQPRPPGGGMYPAAVSSKILPLSNQQSANHDGRPTDGSQYYSPHVQTRYTARPMGPVPPPAGWRRPQPKIPSQESRSVKNNSPNEPPTPSNLPPTVLPSHYGSPHSGRSPALGSSSAPYSAHPDSPHSTLSSPYVNRDAPLYPHARAAPPPPIPSAPPSHPPPAPASSSHSRRAPSSSSVSSFGSSSADKKGQNRGTEGRSSLDQDSSSRSSHSGPLTPATDLSSSKLLSKRGIDPTQRPPIPFDLAAPESFDESNETSLTLGKQSDWATETASAIQRLSQIGSTPDLQGTLKADKRTAVRFGDLPKVSDAEDDSPLTAPPHAGRSFIEDDESSESESSEGGTWARPMVPHSSSTSSSAGSKKEHRPSLRLQISQKTIPQETPSTKTTQANSNIASSSSRASPQRTADIKKQKILTNRLPGRPKTAPTTQNAPSPQPKRRVGLAVPDSAGGNQSGINRRKSFRRRDEDWAFRPPIEQVYENLEEFFPDHDLDKPLAKTSMPDALDPEPEPEPEPEQNKKLAHRKSIRRVAMDRKDRLAKAKSMQIDAGPVPNNPLMRRRSTKMWGRKVEEVSGAAASQLKLGAIPESPTDEDPKNFSFKWVKGELIGKGTFGHVYLALLFNTGDMIAVKQVDKPQTASDRDDERQKGMIDAIKSEVQLLENLEHENIVTYLGFEETDLQICIFLEYVNGGSVGRCLRKHGKFEEMVVKSFTRQVLEGLKYLHAQKILHRDLKADNILVDLEGTCKISDFGISKASPGNIYEANVDMSMQGSIFWMAPEVVSNQRRGYSAKVDIWSLGCLVLEMFCGKRPWSDDEAIQAMFKLGAERLAPPIPDEVKQNAVASHFLNTCFTIDPTQRPTTDRLVLHKFLDLELGWTFAESELGKAIIIGRENKGRKKLKGRP